MAVKTLKTGGEVGVIEVVGNLLGGEETMALRQSVAELLEENYKRVVVDFTNVPFINSAGLGVLIAAHTSSVRRGCHLILCNINKSVNSLLVITRLNLVLDVKDTREEAVLSPA